MSEQEASLAVGTILEGRHRLLTDGVRNDLGLVYRAHDMQEDRLVLLLVLDARWGSGEEARRRLQEMEETLKGLAIPGLVAYEHVGLVDGQLYAARPSRRDQSLAELLARRRRLDIATAVAITIRLCEVLAPAHRAGLVHGSLSPHCVLVEEPGHTGEAVGLTVSLLDCGLLPALRPAAGSQGRPWGRAPYFSPEEAGLQEVHPSSDVYVIGSLLYAMLTGRPPFRAGDEMVLATQHLHQEPPSLEILLPNVPPALVQIVERASAKEPTARYRNAGQLAQILRSQLGSQPPLRQPRPAAAPQTAAHGRLVVPPPPASPRLAPQPSPGIYALEEAEYDLDEPEGVDWLMIGLLIAAVIAVLGLIPLWHTVYRRYTGPPPASAPVLIYPLLGDSPWILPAVQGAAAQTEQSAALDPFDPIWYTGVLARQIPSQPLSGDRATSACVLKWAGNPAVWEWSLRVSDTEHSKLAGQCGVEA